MKKYTVQTTYLFQRDYNDIISYIRNNLGNEIAAKKYQKLFKESLVKLKFVGSGLPIIEIKGNTTSSIRRLRVKRFAIIYEVDEQNKTINALRIVHQSENWQERFC